MKKMTVFVHQSKIVLFVFILCSVFYIRASEAAKDNNGFDDRFTYDIYLVGKDEPSSVIRRVEITRFQQVGGKTFLVIKFCIASTTLKCTYTNF